MTSHDLKKVPAITHGTHGIRVCVILCLLGSAASEGV